MADDKIRELSRKLADKLYATPLMSWADIGEIIRAELKPLLDAGEKLLVTRRRGSDLDADRAADELRAELKGWTK